MLFTAACCRTNTTHSMTTDISAPALPCGVRTSSRAAASSAFSMSELHADEEMAIENASSGFARMRGRTKDAYSGVMRTSSKSWGWRPGGSDEVEMYWSSCCGKNETWSQHSASKVDGARYTLGIRTLSLILSNKGMAIRIPDFALRIGSSSSGRCTHQSASDHKLEA